MNSWVEETFHEFGTICRDIAAGVFGGAVVISITNPNYWGYALIGGLFLAVGLVLELKFKERGHLHGQNDSRDRCKRS
jgi:hypothetical protein